MRAVQVSSLDGPEAVRVVELDEPNGDGAVVVDVYAAGVAFPDALLTRGLSSTDRTRRLCPEPRRRAWCAVRQRARTSARATGWRL